MRDDGGPAFPTEPKNHGYEGSEGTGSGSGMSLRDYFAAKAVAAMVACHQQHNIDTRDPSRAEEGLLNFTEPDCQGMMTKIDCDGRTMAETAYYIADEMLKARL